MSDKQSYVQNVKLGTNEIKHLLCKLVRNYLNTETIK